MYQLPICKACGEVLVVAEQHSHEYKREVQLNGSLARPNKSQFRYFTSQFLHCPGCQQLYAVKHDDLDRIVRGRKLSASKYQVGRIT